MNVALIGPRGCGKSTIGRRLAGLTGRRFVDLDDVVMGEFDEPTVHQIWAAKGEATWRATELEALERVLDADDQVVALGGGVPMIAAAATLLQAQRASGKTRTVYLACGVAELARRLTVEPGDRPSITGADPVDEIALVLARREPTYREVSDLMLDTTNLDPDEIAVALKLWLESTP